MEESWDNDSTIQQPMQYERTNPFSETSSIQNQNKFQKQNNSRFNNYQNNSGQGRHFHEENANNRRHRVSSRGSSDGNENQCTLFIESSKIGKLIGRGGSQIKELQEQTGVKININKDYTNGDSTLVKIFGSKEAQNKVKSMIDNLLSDKPSEGQFSGNTKNEVSTYSAPEIDWEKAAKEHDEYQKQKWSKYDNIKKNFYIEDPVVANMTKEQVEEIRRVNNNINVQHTFDVNSSNECSTEFGIPNPVENFEQAFRHYPDVLVEIAKQGFEKPSPIQCQAWPILLSGKDMIGIAQTGTGKTLAFLLPALIHIDNQKTPRDKRTGPTVLVMAPTRELALQIEKEVNKYHYHGIKAVCIYGGGDRKGQMNIVSNGVEIVIATPGRLNDLVQTGVLDVKCVSYLVLDEADRMLDMGFEPQIRKTLLDIRPDRQSVMTSATWPPGVRRLAESYMKSPITVCVGSLDLKAVHSVTQKIYIIDEEEKSNLLQQFFQNMGLDDKVIVFFGKKSKVDDLGSDLALNGIKCQSIHGGREQNDREQALEDIKSGDVRILLATDVASRGIDIEDITHVLNYDFPRDIEEYVHRVGRTGRAGRTGESISFMTRKDWSQANELIKILEEAEQEIPEELYDMCERYKAMQKRRAQEREGDRNNSSRYGGCAGRGGGRGKWGGRDNYGRNGGSRW